MKNVKLNFPKFIYVIVCLLSLTATFSSCSKKRENPIPQPPKPVNYTVTASADGKQAGVDTSKAVATIKASYITPARKLVYQINFSGIDPASIDIHQGTATAIGDILFNIKKNKDMKYTSPINGEVILSEAQEKAFMKDTYLNITSTKFSKGHIRGKIKLTKDK